MKYPRKVHIGFQEGTCPLKCNKCLAFSKSRKNEKQMRKMPLEKAQKLIDEISQMKAVPAIQPSIYAEPFSNNDLRDIIIYCGRKTVPLNIITNGILIDNQYIEFLIENLGRDSVISFSLDAVTQETYEKVRGLYNLAELEDKILRLLKNRDNKGPRISVNFTYEEDNYSERNQFLDKWKNKADAVRINVALDMQRKVPKIYRKSSIIKNADVCPFMTETITIDSDGEVRICPADAFGETFVGNAFEEGIVSVWNGQKMEMMRQKYRDGKIGREDFCFGCEWGESIYLFHKKTENEKYILMEAEYGLYYNRKNE